MIEKLAEELWKRGADVSLNDLRKWVRWVPENPEQLAEPVAQLQERAGKSWFAVVLLNQVGHMFRDPKEAEEYIRALAGSDVNPVTAIITWRKERTSPYIALHKRADVPKYIESTETVVEFFKNVYRYEMGVDFDEIEEKIRGVVEEKLLEDFFRLVDIDAPMAPEEFVKRVEKAIDVLAAAKEQGLDIKMVFRKWDELADQGGERMVKLAAAVKAVAERAVRERFWESVSKLLESNGVRVFDGEVPDDTIGAFYYLGMADISADTVDLSEAETFIENLATLLRNARAIPMYSIGEVAEIIRKMNIEKMDSRADLEFASSVLAQLDRRAAKIFVESDVGEEVVEAILRARKEGVDEEKIVEAVNEVLLEAYRGSIAGKEEVAQYLEKRLFS